MQGTEHNGSGSDARPSRCDKPKAGKIHTACEKSVIVIRTAGFSVRVNYRYHVEVERLILLLLSVQSGTAQIRRMVLQLVVVLASCSSDFVFIIGVHSRIMIVVYRSCSSISESKPLSKSSTANAKSMKFFHKNGVG